MPQSALSLSGLPYWNPNTLKACVFIQIDYNDPRYARAATEVRRRHDNGEAEANITSAVRDFLIVTGLVKGDEVVEENLSAQRSPRDLRSRPERGCSGVRA